MVKFGGEVGDELLELCVSPKQQHGFRSRCTFLAESYVYQAGITIQAYDDLTTNGNVLGIVYESGTCQRTLSYDTVITGQNTGAAAQQQGFVLDTAENAALQSTDINGVLGLAFASFSDSVSKFVQESCHSASG
jgi:hypothetical protein